MLAAAPFVYRPDVAQTRNVTDAGDQENDRSHVAVVARGGALTMAGFVASAGLQFLLVVVVTHGVTTAEAGAFFEAVALFMILSNWGEFGADTAMVRMIPRLRALGRGADIPPTVRSGAVPVFCAGILVGVVVVVLAPWLSDAFFSPPQAGEAATYLRLFGAMLPVASVATVMLAATRGFATMTPYVAVQNVGVPLGRVLMVGAAVLAGGSALAIGLAWSAPLVCSLVVALIWYRALVNRDRPAWTGVPRPTRELAVELWRFAGPRAMAAVFGVTITWFDVLLVGALASTREAAIYAAISRLAVVGTYALQAMGMAVAPQFSELVTLGERVRLDHLYQASTWWMIAVTWPLYLLLLIFPSVFAGMFGSSYTAGATALAILSAAGLFNLATGNITVLLLMAGNSMLNMLNAAGSLTINIVLNLILIPRYGMNGAAVAWAASIVANNLAALIQVNRLLGQRPFGALYWLVTGGSVGCFGVVAVAGRLVAGETLHTLVAVVVVGSSLYVLFLWLMRERLELGALVASFGWRGGRLG